MKYIKPHKLKVLTVMFFGAGIWGTAVGLFFIKPIVIYLVIFAVINLCLGALFGYRLLTQEKPSPDKKRKK